VREIPYADRWLDGLPVGDVADEEAQWVQVGDVRDDGLEAGKEKVADGEVGPDAIGRESVDLGSQFAGAVVYDVMRHCHGFPSHKKHVIM